MSTKLGKPAWGQKLAQVRYPRNVTCDGPHELEGGGKRALFDLSFRHATTKT